MGGGGGKVRDIFAQMDTMASGTIFSDHGNVYNIDSILQTNKHISSALMKLHALSPFVVYTLLDHA